MRKSRIASLIAMGAMSLPLLTSITSAVAVSPRSTPAIGTQLTELKAFNTVTEHDFGWSVAVSGTTAFVGAGDHADHASRAYVFTGTPSGWKQTAELKGSGAAVVPMTKERKSL